MQFSNSELIMMGTAFKKLFQPNPPDLVEYPAITEWMKEAPILLIEYDGSLDKEPAKGREHRMELYSVYDGDIKSLVEYLRSIYPEHKALSKWELIFLIASKLSSTDKVIDQALSQKVFGSQEATVEETPQLPDEHLTMQSSSHESTPVEESKTTTEAVTEEQPKYGSIEIQDIVTEQVDVVAAPEKTEELATPNTKSDDGSSGNGQATEEDSLIDTQNNIIKNGSKEEHKMADLKDLMNAVQDMGGEASNPAAEATAPEAVKSSNAAAEKEREKAAMALAAKIVGGQLKEKQTYMIKNTVTAIVSSQKPAALRVKSSNGKATKEVDAEKAAGEIKKKLEAFIVNVSGKKNITIEEFEALSTEEKYANVVIKEGNNAVAKAAAMFELYKQIMANPLGEYTAFIPGLDKISYPTKGYVIGSTPMPVDEFLGVLANDTTGTLFAEGYIDAEGHVVGDDKEAVSFGLGVATRTKDAESNQINLTKRATKVPVIRPRNKKKFLADGTRVQYLFTKEDVENVGTASFKALINVAGVDCNAAVSYYSLDEQGNKEVRSANEDGTKNYKSKVASISLSVPVVKIVKEFGPAFTAEGEDIIVTASRWDVTIGGGSNNADPMAENISQTPIINTYAQIILGNLKMPESMKGTAVVTMLEAAANEQAAKVAQQTEDELN